MAKVGFWLQGAKGKLADGVLQKGENGTIVRQKVTPANPQTARQMLTRVAFATIAMAAKYMLPVIGQTFQGAGNETKNRRAFMKANINRLKGLYKQFLDAEAAGDTSGIDVGYAVPKGYKTLVPNPYILSQGELLVPSAFSIAKEYNSAAVDSFEYFNTQFAISAGTYSAARLWNMFFGLAASQQVTYVGIALKARSVMPLGPFLAPEYWLRYGRLISARLVLKASGDPITITGETTQAQLTTALKSMIDTEKSNATFISGIDNAIDINAGSGTINVTVDMGSCFDIIMEALAPGETNYVPAQGCIISEYSNGEWAYSNSELVNLNSFGGDFAQTQYGTQYRLAAPTYVKRGSSAESDMYTRQGGDVDELGE